MSATKRKAKTPPHVHTFQPYPADTRFGYCACGATCNMSPREDGALAPITSANPMVARYGRYTGQADAICRNCIHLINYRHHDQSYLKCDLRTLTHGAGSDHRAKWEACGKYRAARAHVDEEIAERQSRGDRIRSAPVVDGPIVEGAYVRIIEHARPAYSPHLRNWVGVTVGYSRNCTTKVCRWLVDYARVPGQYGRDEVREEHLERVQPPQAESGEGR